MRVQTQSYPHSAVRAMVESIAFSENLAEVKAEAWDEGHTHCFHVENPLSTENPYREEKK